MDNGVRVEAGSEENIWSTKVLAIVRRCGRKILRVRTEGNIMAVTPDPKAGVLRKHEHSSPQVVASLVVATNRNTNLLCQEICRDGVDNLGGMLLFGDDPAGGLVQSLRTHIAAAAGCQLLDLHYCLADGGCILQRERVAYAHYVTVWPWQIEPVHHDCASTLL